MSPDPSTNPFAAARPARSTGPPTPVRVWAGFLVQRGIRLLLLPTIFALLTLLTSRELGLPGGAVAIVALGFALVWVPTSIWLAWARFWRPHSDDYALILTTGELLDRAAFIHVVRAQVAEVSIMTVGMLAMGAAFPLRFGWWGAPALILTAVAAIWVGWVLGARLWFASAVVRLASDDAHGTLRSLKHTRILRLRSRGRDALRFTEAQALLRLEGPVRPLELIQDIRKKKPLQADYLESMLKLHQGYRPPPALLETEPESLPRKIVHTQLRALVALYDQNPDDALSAVKAWEPTREWLPFRQRRTFDLLAAAAHQQAGRTAEARRHLSLVETPLDQMTAMFLAYPFVWELLQAIRPSEE